MIYTIVCPVQTTEDFKIDRCFECRSFEQHLGKAHTVHCKKNRSRIHKRDFEGAFWSNRLGIPDKVVVEATEEPKQKG